MPLKNFFDEQLASLRQFMASAELTMCALQHAPDIKRLLMKLLARLDEDDTNPHVMLVIDADFEDTDQYFRAALADIQAQNEAFRDSLAEIGVELPTADDSPQLSPRHRFKRYVADVAESLPESVGAYVVILDAAEIRDDQPFKEAMEYLGHLTRGQRAKYLVLDRLANPILHDLPQRTARGVIQTFHLPPEEIEERVKQDLQQGKLNPDEQRQYTAMAGSFAFAHGRLDEALEQQTKVVALADENGMPADQATARYNLGNTHLKREEFEQAERCFGQAAALCLEHELNPLLAMVLCNLGVTLQRQGRIDEAVESFDVARRTFKAVGNPPAEAYALDCKASSLSLEDDRHEEAEHAWREALAIYDGIQNEAFADARAGGRTDILEKLERFFQATNQTDKLDQLRQAAEVAR